MKSVVGGFFMALIAAPAIAQDASGLLGVWAGSSRAVTAGAGGHYQDGDTAPRFVSAELEIVWLEHDGGRLIGTISSPNYTEPKIAVLSIDGETIFTTDLDGSSMGRILNPNAFELCYTQSSEGANQMTVSCVLFERQTQ